MIVKLQKYTDRDLYERDYPHEIETVDTLTLAVDIARERLRTTRRKRREEPSLWVGYKIFDLHGELKYKLPL